MVMKELSFKFYFRCGKHLIVSTSITGSILLFLFMLYYVFWCSNIKIEVLFFAMFYILTSNIFNYYLIKSKSIKFDSKSIFIKGKSNNWEEISIKSIIKIKRTYYYFYTIHYASIDAVEKKVVFFISPNPSIYKSNKVKEVLSYV